MSYQDSLSALNDASSLKEHLVNVHEVVQGYFPFIARIAVILYDSKTNVLKTYVHSSGGDDPLSNYQTSLDDAPSLKHLLEQGRPRVINNQLAFEGGSMNTPGASPVRDTRPAIPCPCTTRACSLDSSSSTPPSGMCLPRWSCSKWTFSPISFP